MTITMTTERKKHIRHHHSAWHWFKRGQAATEDSTREVYASKLRAAGYPEYADKLTPGDHLEVVAGETPKRTRARRKAE